MTDWIAQLASEDSAARVAAAEALYKQGCTLGEAAVAPWRANPELSALLTGPPTVGVAVQPVNFEKIREAMGSPRLAEVPPDQYASEFELHLGEARLDILTTRGGGAIERFMEKFGEGIQQIEYPVKNVDRATQLLRERFALEPVYSETRRGADGTRVNFFLVETFEGRKALIELVEVSARERS